jgi:predicted nucleic-acid-binding Zn-ribbon protein
MTNGNNDLLPRINVRNKSVPLDKITPFMINMMNIDEKNFYIEVCRQLYTEIYEI